MFRFRPLARGTWLLLLAGAILGAGCSRTGPGNNSDSAASGGAKSGDILTEKIGEYMPPLDQGRLEIAAPKGWNWANPGGSVLVAFKPKDAEINALPRVLLSVEDSPFPEIDDVTSGNAQDFAILVGDSLADTKLQEPVQAVKVAGQPFARYELLGKRRGQIVVQQILKTIVSGRAYTLQLEVYQPQLDQHKIALRVIATSMKFPARDAEAAADSTESDPLEPDAAESKEKADTPDAEPKS